MLTLEDAQAKKRHDFSPFPLFAVRSFELYTCTYRRKYFWTRCGFTLFSATAMATITQRIAIPFPANWNSSLGWESSQIVFPVPRLEPNLIASKNPGHWSSLCEQHPPASHAGSKLRYLSPAAAGCAEVGMELLKFSWVTCQIPTLASDEIFSVGP